MGEGDAGRASRWGDDDEGSAAQAEVRDGKRRREANGPRGSVVLLVTGVIVAALVGGGLAINRFVLQDNDADVAVEAVPTTEGGEIDVEPVGTSATRLFTRTTESGIEVRVYESDDANMWGPGFVPEDVPDWCIPVSSVSATALTLDAIGQAQMPRSKEAPPDPAISFGLGGIVEEAPLALLVVQLADTVTQARLSHPSGATDSMEPIDGLAVLAVNVPMPDDDADDANGAFFDPWNGIASTLALEVLHADGGSDRYTQNDLMNGIPMWGSPECNPGMMTEGTAPEMTAPDLKLPKPGAEQPVDPVADRAAIEQAFVALYNDLGSKATLFRYLDDASGIDLTMKAIMRDHGDAIRAMEPEIDEMVFFSPIEASFTYTSGLDPWDDGFSGTLQSFGRARIVNGVWLITRSTVCQEIMKVGVQCTI